MPSDLPPAKPIRRLMSSGLWLLKMSLLMSLLVVSRLARISPDSVLTATLPARPVAADTAQPVVAKAPTPPLIAGTRLLNGRL